MSTVKLGRLRGCRCCDVLRVGKGKGINGRRFALWWWADDARLLSRRGELGACGPGWSGNMERPLIPPLVA